MRDPAHPRGLLGLPVPAITPGSRDPFELFDWQPGDGLTVRRWWGSGA